MVSLLCCCFTNSILAKQEKKTDLKLKETSMRELELKKEILNLEKEILNLEKELQSSKTLSDEDKPQDN